MPTDRPTVHNVAQRGEYLLQICAVRSYPKSRWASADVCIRDVRIAIWDLDESHLDSKNVKLVMAGAQCISNRDAPRDGTLLVLAETPVSHSTRCIKIPSTRSPLRCTEVFLNPPTQPTRIRSIGIADFATAIHPAARRRRPRPPASASLCHLVVCSFRFPKAVCVYNRSPDRQSGDPLKKKEFSFSSQRRHKDQLIR